MQYGYDAASNRTKMTDPQSIPTTYGYDTLNRLSSLTYNGQTPNYTFGYDTLSRRNSLTRPNGIATSYGYDPVSNLLSVLHKLGTTTLDGATYTYDGANNRKTRTDKRTNVTLTYAYDNIYQLKTAKQGTTTKESYTYDLVGNRLSSLGVSPYNYNSSNELTSIGSSNYTYDNNGNRKTDPSGAQYTWDFENRLTQVVLPGSGGTVNFKYDPFGRRIQKSFTQGSTTTTTDYVYEGANVLESLNQSGTILARHVDTIRVDEPLEEAVFTTTSYYEQDGLGSASSLSNSAGTLANTYSYDSYGKLLSSGGTLANPFLYTGREFDAESAIYEYRARYYDQNIGRFLSEDPIAFDGGINFYRYVENDPVDSTDPFGTSTYQCTKELHSVKHPTNSGRKSITDASWNPLYHEYLCVIGADGIPRCGGQDKGPGIAFGNTVPSKPSNDEFKPNRCEKISDNDNCYDQCVLNFITSPVRPPYGIDTWLIPSSGTQCQEWANIVEKTCKQQCNKKTK